MPKLAGINHLRAVRALEKAGFKIVNQGKHVVMSDGNRILTIPRHNPVKPSRSFSGPQLGCCRRASQITHAISSEMACGQCCGARLRSCNPGRPASSNQVGTERGLDDLLRDRVLKEAVPL